MMSILSPLDGQAGEQLRASASAKLPTPFGEFKAVAFDVPPGLVYVALILGDMGDGRDVLARLHSECLTGDTFGSLRCDCGSQLKASLRSIAAAGRGVLLYVTGHEGRGIGLVKKLMAYAEQDLGADTVDANLHLGLPADARSYTTAAQVLSSLGVQSVRLLTNNPDKALALEACGVRVAERVPVPVVPHARSHEYLRTKESRMGHQEPLGGALPELTAEGADVRRLMGTVRARPDRPYVLLKYAQSLDGRLATATGDSRWVSGEEERAVSHSLRASCDAVLVGRATVETDDPQLTVRLVEGSSPARVVLDSTLSSPSDARIFADGGRTIVVSLADCDPDRKRLLQRLGVAVHHAPPGPGGVALAETLLLLRRLGVTSVLVEGGGRVITSFLASGLVDRLVVGVSPRILGEGVDAVGALGIDSVAGAIGLDDRVVSVVGQDVLIAGDVVWSAGAGQVQRT